MFTHVFLAVFGWLPDGFGTLALIGSVVIGIGWIVTAGTTAVDTSLDVAMDRCGMPLVDPNSGETVAVCDRLEWHLGHHRDGFPGHHVWSAFELVCTCRQPFGWSGRTADVMTCSGCGRTLSPDEFYLAPNEHLTQWRGQVMVLAPVSVH